LLLDASTETEIDTEVDADTLACGVCVCVLRVEFTDGSFLEIVVAGGLFKMVAEVDFFAIKFAVSVKPEDVWGWSTASFSGTGALAVGSSRFCGCGCGTVLGGTARPTASAAFAVFL
jgi:hypothetical protein